MEGIIREACVEGLGQACKAEQLGADRIELCARLDLDGITPDRETITKAFDVLNIPIRVMVRPRGGNFHYSEAELEEMIQIISFCKEVGVEGVVFGALTDRNEVDLQQTQRLIQAARPLKTVFHRAIESTADIGHSVDQLRSGTDLDAILVSGTGGGKASDHITELRELQGLFIDRELVVCGKITKDNLEGLHQHIGARAYHGKLIVGDLK